MFYSLTSNNSINLLHERASRMIYDDNTSSFRGSLEKEKSFAIHHFTIRLPAIEMFKVSNNIAPTVTDDSFARSHLT